MHLELHQFGVSPPLIWWSMISRYDQLSRSRGGDVTEVASSPRANGGTRGTPYGTRGRRGGASRGRVKFKQGEISKNRIVNNKVHKDVVRTNDLSTINEDDKRH